MGRQAFFVRGEGRIYAGYIIFKQTRNQFFIRKLGENKKINFNTKHVILKNLAEVIFLQKTISVVGHTC